MNDERLNDIEKAAWRLVCKYASERVRQGDSLDWLHSEAAAVLDYFEAHGVEIGGDRLPPDEACMLFEKSKQRGAA